MIFRVLLILLNITLKTRERVRKEIVNSENFFTLNFISKNTGIHPCAVKIAFKELEKECFIEKVNLSIKGQLQEDKK